MRRPALLAVLVMVVCAEGTARAQDTAQPTPTTAPSPSAAPSTSTPTPEAAPPAAAPSEKGFGERGSFLFSVEGVLGFLHQSVSNNGNVNLDSTGFYPGDFPIFGTRFGLHGHSDSGITYGGVGAFAYIGETGSGNGGLTEVQIGPRIGYAGTLPKAPVVGYWGRIGPTFSYLHASAGNGSDDIELLDLSIEAFLVYTPVEHFGVLAGPSFDIALIGNESPQGGGSNHALYSTYGINLGLLFDL